MTNFVHNVVECLQFTVLYDVYSTDEREFIVFSTVKLNSASALILVKGY